MHKAFRGRENDALDTAYVVNAFLKGEPSEAERPKWVYEVTKLASISLNIDIHYLFKILGYISYN